MYKYLHANKQDINSGKVTFLIIQKVLVDTYHAELYLASNEEWDNFDLAKGQQIWSGEVKEFYFKNEEIFQFTKDTKQWDHIIKKRNQKIPCRLCWENKHIKVHYLVVRLDPLHKLKYLPYNFFSDSD